MLLPRNDGWATLFRSINRTTDRSCERALTTHSPDGCQTYLFTANAHVLGDVSKHGGLNEVSFLPDPVPPAHQPRSLCLPGLDQLQNLLRLNFVDLQRRDGPRL